MTGQNAIMMLHGNIVTLHSFSRSSVAFDEREDPGSTTRDSLPALPHTTGLAIAEGIGKELRAWREVSGAFRQEAGNAALNRETATFAAGQLREQLSVQSLGIANARPESLLALFR
ncbi:hypothetical protein NUH88_19950 [Nisaea acidiphila]|uniref:Flagellin C-terminal domain-containing protein n=1 Tax=Nisaea acidiphila TaxID=1862145 RepID=A0A9J7ATK7_9PROT|nr:hypothetical protein [Nisaea acidiphila]UUX49660.1 hypothetical protein NUH88_19950 [Nisaea acidiphila]